jgi:peptidoglycan/LPS O-acetylase OafA/YrhL
MLDWLTRAALRRDAPRMPGSPPPGSDRFPLFDSLRAIAALSVLVFHLTTVQGFGAARPYLLHLDVGVTVFFLISGFLLYRPFVKANIHAKERPEIHAYAWRRFLRIVPAYWVALTVISLWLGRDRLVAGHGLTYYLFGQIYNPARFLGGLGQAWTLCVEVTFYAFLPLWAALMARNRPRSRRARIRREWYGLLVLIGIAVFVKLPGVVPGPTQGVRSSLPRFLDWFALGMGLAVASVVLEGRELPRALRPIERFPGLGLLFAAPFFVIAAQLHVRTITESTFAYHYLYALIAFGLVAPMVIGNQEQGFLRKLLANRIMLWLGLVSYAVYLWHFAVLTQLQEWGTPEAIAHSTGVPEFTVWIVLTVAGTVVISWLSWIVVERPALRLKRDLPWRGTPAERQDAWIVGISGLVLLVLALSAGQFGLLEGALALGAVAALVCLSRGAQQRLARHRLQPADIFVVLGLALAIVASVRFSNASSSPLVKTAFVAATEDGKTLRLYLNGKEIGSTHMKGRLARGTKLLSIGSAAGVLNWSGTIDEAAVFQRALSPSELEAQYRAATRGGQSYADRISSTSGLWGYWRLDDTQGPGARAVNAQRTGVYGPGVKLGVPGLIPGAADSAASFGGGLDSSVLVPGPPPGGPVTIEAWATVGLASGRALLGRPKAYWMGINNSGHWEAVALASKKLYTVSGGPRFLGYKTALRKGSAFLAILAALGIAAGGLARALQAAPGARRKPRRGRPEQRPVSATAVEPEASENGQGFEPVLHAGPERDA